ncbi:hypothetical protein AAFX60_016510 [Aliivibrio fischeri]
MKKIYLAAFVFGVFSVSSSAEMMPYVGEILVLVVLLHQMLILTI